MVWSFQRHLLGSHCLSYPKHPQLMLAWSLNCEVVDGTFLHAVHDSNRRLAVLNQLICTSNPSVPQT